MLWSFRCLAEFDIRRRKDRFSSYTMSTFEGVNSLVAIKTNIHDPNNRCHMPNHAMTGHTHTCSNPNSQISGWTWTYLSQAFTRVNICRGASQRVQIVCCQPKLQSQTVIGLLYRTTTANKGVMTCRNTVIISCETSSCGEPNFNTTGEVSDATGLLIVAFSLS